MRKLMLALYLLFFMALLAKVGTADFASLRKDQLTYCEKVKGGVWQDYKNNYKTVCNKYTE
jgi:hypothetical protein